MKPITVITFLFVLKLQVHAQAKLKFANTVQINVTSSNTPVPSRLTIINGNNQLQTIQAEAADTIAVRPGFIYSATGNFSFRIPDGNFKIYASRGFEYGVDSVTISAKQNSHIKKRINIKREVIPVDLVSVDPHVHTKEYSGHGDATMKERIITIAGEGLDYAVITEHNRAVNIRDSVREMGMDRWFTAITGDELTTKIGHFNIFPVEEPVPSENVTDWKEIADLRKEKKQVVILNHARDEHNGFRPSDTMFQVKEGDFPANAMEVMNSGSQQPDPRQLYMDWLRLWSRGIFLAPVGSSDSHDVSDYIVGQARTYVYGKGDLIDNFLERRVAVSFGLLTTLKVDSIRTNGKVNVVMKIHSPSWIIPDSIKLFANGQMIYSSSLSDRDKQVNNTYQQELNISIPQHEVTLVAVAEGPDPKVPWWPIAKPYQQRSVEAKPIVLGISQTVRVR